MARTIIALVDCNNFYASCERVFNPKLCGRPMVVLSNNDGCIIARSNEAKTLGFEMGEPFFKAKSKVIRHNVAVYSSNFVLYGDMSRRVMQTLATFVPEIEIYSIDEAFLSFTGMEHLDLQAYARMIRATVLKHTDIPVSIGIAETKTLAKIANRIAKKDLSKEGVCSILDREKDLILEKIDVADVWGVGWRYAKKLRGMRVQNARQLRDLDDRWVRKHMTVVGLRTVHELRGIPCIDLEEVPSPKKQIVVSRSFGVPVTSKAELSQAIGSFITRAAEKLRKQSSVAACLSIFIMTSRHDAWQRFMYNSRVHEFSSPTSFTPRMLMHASGMLSKVFRPGVRYKKAGVLLGGICGKDQIQTGLFENKEPNVENAKLMATIDGINASFGRGIVSFASAHRHIGFNMRQNRKSPLYTTRWNDLPKVKAKN